MNYFYYTKLNFISVYVKYENLDQQSFSLPKQCCFILICLFDMLLLYIKNKNAKKKKLMDL